MVALLLDIRTAITILIIPNIVMDLTQIVRGSFPTAILRRFFWLFLWTVVGVFLGTKVLVSLPLWILDLTLGWMVLAFVLSNLFRLDLEVSFHQEKILSPLIGFVGGFLNGMTNVFGPLLAAYLYGLRLPKTAFVKSISAVIVVAKVSQLIAVSSWNLLTPSTLLLSLEVTIFILLSFYAGLKTQDRVNQQTFNRGLLALLSAIGVTLVVRSLR